MRQIKINVIKKNKEKLQQEIRIKVREKDNYKCYFCNIDIKKVSLANTCHHIVPKRIGGSNNIANLITLCNRCHRKLERLNNILIKKVENYYMTEMNGSNNKERSLKREGTCRKLEAEIQEKQQKLQEIKK